MLVDRRKALPELDFLMDLADGCIHDAYEIAKEDFSFRVKNPFGPHDGRRAEFDERREFTLFLMSCRSFLLPSSPSLRFLSRRPVRAPQADVGIQHLRLQSAQRVQRLRPKVFDVLGEACVFLISLLFPVLIVFVPGRLWKRDVRAIAQEARRQAVQSGATPLAPIPPGTFYGAGI